MPNDITSHLKQLSDGNPDGTSFGQNSSDAISFYGATPVPQRSGGDQIAINLGAAAGIALTMQSVTQAPSSVATITIAAQTLTITGGASLSSDHVIINKPAAQAGLGICQARAGTTAATVVVDYCNLSGSAITPTSGESYLVVALRGLASTVALTPAPVASNACVEQQFTVAGLAVGNLVNVIKPTDQAGVGIAGMRVVAQDTLGITFLNDTVTYVTPTANESYSIVALNGLLPVGNTMVFGCNIGTLNSTVSTSAVEQSLTVTGILGNDVALGPMMRTTFQSSSVPIASRITANNIVAITILNYSGVAGVTPTANEVWYQSITRMNPAAPLLLYTVNLAPTAVGNNTTAEQTFTVTGLVSGTAVVVNNLAPTSGLGIVGYRVSGANTLAITFANPTSTTITPPAGSYLVGNFQTLVGSNGSEVIQEVNPLSDAAPSLLNELRNTLAGNGMIAGA